MLPDTKHLTEPARAIEHTDLERRLRAADPPAFLVPERILRRVIKSHAHPPGIGLRVPHHKSYVISGADLAEMVAPAELGMPADGPWPPIVILLRRPKADERIGRSEQALLRDCQRLLFHACVHVAFDELHQRGKLGTPEGNERIEQVGLTEFEEIESVLAQENFLLPPRDRVTVVIEFAALFLELRHFAPELVGDYFPAIGRPDDVEALLAEDIDVAGLLAACRLEDGVAPPAEPPPPLAAASAGLAAPLQEAAFRTLTAAAEHARGRGNVVRAAILRCRAVSLTSTDNAEHALAEARADIDLLVDRLRPALDLNGDALDQWRHALSALLPRIAAGFRSVEARLLYDLQKVCIDHEREIYSSDLVEWALSLGKLGITRPMPAHREVLRFRHLLRAEHRLPALSLADAERQLLRQLLDDALRRMEHKLRQRFRPVVAQALRDVNLQPENLPERIAHDKLIEELLDRVTERGFVNISDLRDALSRNQLKLPDLAGPGEFLLGDKLIRLNRRLAVLLDGVYRRGEIYRRWLQRFSSLAFGTRVGRFLTQFAALPFGGAFVALDGLSHLLHILGIHSHLSTPVNVGLLGTFLLGILNWPAFRTGTLRLLSRLGGWLKKVFVDMPVSVSRLAAVRWLVTSWPVRFFNRWLAKPFVIGALTLAVCWWADPSWEVVVPVTGAVFAFSLLLLNSRLGRDLEEWVVDWLAHNWQRLRTSLLPNVFRFVMDSFRNLLDLVERILYSIDEWFRFKSGESRFTFALKVALGPVWRFVTYVVRFCLTLLIEPQINPIKHFPVVTVSHKLLLPFIPLLRDFFHVTFSMERPTAFGLAGLIVAGIPGIFGFLVWELKENWRLYRSNRPRDLSPVIVGAHGETVTRLLRRGFHSGTVPKLFARLRKARRKGRRRAARRAHEGLHHVETEVRRFVERELLAILRQCSSWQGLSIELVAIRLATNRICLELCCPDLPDDCLRMFIDDRAGTLVARLDSIAWFEQLSAGQRDAMNSALDGFYRLAGVARVNEKPIAPLSWETWVATWR
ncbi:MAG: hypothetical protein FJ271_14180 [Planctomycetes bacterium]|nr:hypothetical protein [Planctomycetota bacterium]